MRRVLVAGMLLALATTLKGSASADEIVVSVVTDVHLDPNYDPMVKQEARCQKGHAQAEKKAKYGRKGCDSPITLYTSTLAKLRSVGKDVSLIVVPGDIVTHNIPMGHGQPFDRARYQRLKDVIHQFTDEMTKQFPSTRIVFTHGNDDYVYNYQVPTSSMKHEHYSFLYQEWITNVKANWQADTRENRESFMFSGSYTMELNPRLRIISFNSMYFDKYNHEANDPGVADTLLQWIDQQLAATLQAGKRAILVYHIPQGKFVSPSGAQWFWIEKYEERWRAMLEKYKEAVSILLTGHTHVSFVEVSEMVMYADSFLTRAQSFLASRGASYYGSTLVNRAVSPNLVVNPGFTLIHFSQPFRYPNYLEEYTFKIEESVGKEDDPMKYWEFLYDSRKDLQVEDYSPAGVVKFIESLVKDPMKLLRYLCYKMGVKPGSPEDSELVRALATHICHLYFNDPSFCPQLMATL